MKNIAKIKTFFGLFDLKENNDWEKAEKIAFKKQKNSMGFTTENEELDEKMNNFIKNKKIISIKMNLVPDFREYTKILYSILIYWE